MNKKTIQALILVFLCSISGVASASSSYARYMSRAGKNLMFLCVPVLQKTSKLAAMAYEDSIPGGEAQFASLSFQTYEMLYKGEMLRRIAVQKNPGQLNESVSLFNTYSKQMSADELIELSQKCTDSYASLKKAASITSEDEFAVMMASEKAVTDIRAAQDEDFRLSLQAVVVPEPEIKQEVVATPVAQTESPESDKKEANPDYTLPLGMNESVPIDSHGKKLMGVLPSAAKPWTTAQFLTFLSLTLALSMAIWCAIYGSVKAYEHYAPRLRVLVRWNLRRVQLRRRAKSKLKALSAKPAAAICALRTRFFFLGKTKCPVTVNHE